MALEPSGLFDCVSLKIVKPVSIGYLTLFIILLLGEILKNYWYFVEWWWGWRLVMEWR